MNVKIISTKTIYYENFVSTRVINILNINWLIYRYNIQRLCLVFKGLAFYV